MKNINTRRWSIIIFFIVSLIILGSIIYYFACDIGTVNDFLISLEYDEPVWFDSNFDDAEALVDEMKAKELFTSGSSLEIYNLQGLTDADSNHVYLFDDSNDKVGYVNPKQMSTLTEPEKYSLTTTLIYEIKRDNDYDSIPLLGTDIEVLRKYSDSAKIKTSGDKEVKAALDVFIAARESQEEDEYVGDYDTLETAYMEFISSIAKELTTNTDKYKLFLAPEIYDILSGKDIVVNEDASIESVLDRVADINDEYWNSNTGEINLYNVQISPDSLNIYKSLELSNCFIKYQYGREDANVYNIDCYKYGLILYYYALNENPDIEKYLKRQDRIKNGEATDIPEIEDIEESTTPIKNYLTEPYKVEFADRTEAPGDVRYIRDPDTNKILISITDFNNYYGTSYTLDDMQYETAKEETVDEDFIDLSDINLLTGDIWYYDSDMQKLYIQEPLSYDESETEDFYTSIEGYPLPVVLLNLETGKENPDDAEGYIDFVNGVLAHSYTKDYDDLVYAVQDYLRCIEYSELYEEDDDYSIEDTLMNYHYYLLEGLRDKRSWNFLTTTVKDFLNFDNDLDTIEYNEDNVKDFVINLRAGNYEDITAIPEGCEGIYKVMQFIYENSYSGNYPETAYPNIEMSQLSGLSLTIFMHDCHEMPDFYDLWYSDEVVSAGSEES